MPMTGKASRCACPPSWGPCPPCAAIATLLHPMVHPLATCLCRSWSVRGGLVDSPDRPLDRSIDRGGHDVQHLASKLDNLPSLRAAEIAEPRSLCWFAVGSRTGDDRRRHSRD